MTSTAYHTIKQQSSIISQAPHKHTHKHLSNLFATTWQSCLLYAYLGELVKGNFEELARTLAELFANILGRACQALLLDVVMHR